MKSQTKENALDLFRTIEYITIATTDAQGNPWGTPVFYAYDEQYNIYWSSLAESVHSQNINRNHTAFLTLNSTQKGAWLGVYMNCNVECLEDEEEIIEALQLLGKRRGDPYKNMNKFLSKKLQRVYKATPLQIWMNDAEKDDDGDFVRDFRVEVVL